MFAHSKNSQVFLLMLVLPLIILAFKIAAQTARDENVAVNLHHLFCRHTSARVQIVHVLRDEQELVRVLGQSRDCFVCGIRSRDADALPPLAVPFPN